MLFSCQRRVEQPPSFVIIQLDDLGYDDLGINGNRLVETPHIDSFAAVSMRLEQFYVNPVCAPTRASLLTGRDFIKTGVSHVHGGKDFLSLDEVTFAELLQKEGYRTGMWGKWHSGHARGYYPWQRGFDDAYMAQLYKHRNSRGMLNGKKVSHKKWADEVIVNYALDFMQRNKNQPFLAYLSFLTVHAPLETPDSLRSKYTSKGLSHNLSTLYGMVEHVDHYIGKLLSAMDTMGLLQHTVIFFMSDNGPAVLNAELTEKDREIRYVSDMKGHKGNIWENGVRSPMFVYWRGITRPVIDYTLTDITDVFPTILDLAGADIPEGVKKIDGFSFSDLIEKGNVTEREKVSYNYANRGWPPTDQPWTPQGVLDEYRPVRQADKPKEVYDDQIISVRKGAFKLMHNPGSAKGSAETSGGYVLIDISSDPYEEYNLYNDMPDVAADLQSLLKNWWQSVLEEPSSFAMPVFTIGAGGQTEYEILAKAPLSTSDNVVSAFNWLSNWSDPGDFAEYAIDVETPGLYEISLIYSGKPTGATIAAGTPASSISNSVETYDKAILGSIELGRNDTLIRVELIKNPAGLDVFPRLEKIVLRPK